MNTLHENLMLSLKEAAKFAKLCYENCDTEREYEVYTEIRKRLMYGLIDAGAVGGEA